MKSNLFSFFFKFKFLPWSFIIAFGVLLLLLLSWWLIPCFDENWFGENKSKTELLTYIGAIVGSIFFLGQLFENGKLIKLPLSLRIALCVLLLLLLSWWFVPCFDEYWFGVNNSRTVLLIYFGAIFSSLFFVGQLFENGKLIKLPLSIRIALSVLLLLILSWWLFSDFENFLFGKKMTKAEVLTYIGAFVTSIILLGQLFENSRRNDISQKANELRQKSDLDIRFKDAATLLGSQDSGSIIAGIFALHQIAVDSSKTQGQEHYVNTINQIFCATIRDGRKDTVILRTILDLFVENHYKERFFIKAKLAGLDFSGANFSGANLSWSLFVGTNLSLADFSGANLFNANLEQANLTRTNLSNAKINFANLTRAKLTNTNLTDANLSDANLSDAFLIEADLTGANLTGANLTRTYFFQTILKGTMFNFASNNGIILPSGDTYSTLFEKAKRIIGSDDMTPDVLSKMFEFVLEEKTSTEKSIVLNPEGTQKVEKKEEQPPMPKKRSKAKPEEPLSQTKP